MDPLSPHLPTRASALLAGPSKVRTYDASGGAVTKRLASHNLSLLPALPSGSVVHDNACGPGTVTQLLLNSHASPETTLKIHATDTDQIFLDVLKAEVDEKGWPVEVSNQAGEKLGFADEFFDLSVTNIGIFFMSDGGLDGAKEIYRTLKTGGTAVVNCWKLITWFFPIKTIHDRFRPGKPFPAPVINWNDGSQLKKIMLEAGFKEENMRMEESETSTQIPEGEFRDWAEKAWAYLGGIGRWQEEDEGNWDASVDYLVELMLAMKTTAVVDGVVQMKASQWVVIAQK
ncbi:S-adenosyl-L-methionine-dependent methyltransferase [Aaosphaeria arxii CBS 175.79]|uniref:S-adenosyl-L-methionine-dependent methyltransferase n=1 Tax=Aaosphaeria arxii CBS 175.79 TaxID=1450172 RepID=A0A6A5XEE5_9PLEO|nr:S-adenosyl-L-methionine-dependent methyltransferase [Aaosphaeria arxii CBS 175.79]KAF2011432.1 S-adenosyl-L-methionine-dependent methyltransferase [Aaosphaeria arxii CBS 175.79]